MGKVSENKKSTKLASRKKKGVNMTPFAGKVKAFKHVDAIAYQQKIRE
jgi:hypothetical protein